MPEAGTEALPQPGVLGLAMGVYAIAMSMGFMAAFPAVGTVVLASGWRAAWAGI